MKRFVLIFLFLLLPQSPVFAEGVTNGNSAIRFENHSAVKESVRLDQPVKGIKIVDGENTTVIDAPTPVFEVAQLELQSIASEEAKQIASPTATFDEPITPTPAPQSKETRSNSFADFFRIPLNFLFGLFD